MAYIKPFRFYCQKVIPMVFDDSLSYYEVLCKVVTKLNEMGASVNEINDALEELIAELPDDIKEKIDEYVHTDEFKDLVEEIVGEFGVTSINGKVGAVKITGEDINYDDDPDSTTITEAIGSRVAKNTEESIHKQIYAKNTDGTQFLQNLDSSASDKGGGDVPVRNVNGNLETGTPTQNLECATKKYVDDEIDELDNDKVNKIISGTTKKVYVHTGAIQSDLDIDSTPTSGSDHLITSGGVASAISVVQSVTEFNLQPSAFVTAGAVRLVKYGKLCFFNGTFKVGEVSAAGTILFTSNNITPINTATIMAVSVILNGKNTDIQIQDGTIMTNGPMTTNGYYVFSGNYISN